MSVTNEAIFNFGGFCTTDIQLDRLVDQFRVTKRLPAQIRLGVYSEW